MSIAYQCWEMGVASTVSYKGQSHSLVVGASQYNGENGSTLRCHHHSSPSHETSFSNFAMYMQQQQQPPQSDLKAHHHPKDMPKENMASVRFASSPSQISSPISAAASSPTEAAPEVTPKQAETNVTTSSVTTERSVDEKATTTSTIGEAQSKRLEAGLPGTIIAGGSLSGALLADRGLRVKVSSKAKPGVVEHIVPVSGGSPYGGFMYGSLRNNNAQVEHSSESSSSICQASEDSGSCSSGDTGGEEAQSAYRGPLTTMMSALDESLPIK